MKKFFLLLVYLVATALSARAADALYHNIGTVPCGDAPQIDAFVFLNDGSFCADTASGALFGVNTAIPYTTQNTLSFTNNGLMQSGRGFQLDFVTEDGFHHPAANIVNSAGGSSGPSTIFGGSLVLLSATNLVNKGLLQSGASGLMQLSGQNLNLARGGIGSDAASGGGACLPNFFLSPPYLTPTNFIPISGQVLDQYWGAGTDTNLVPNQIVRQLGRNFTVQSPPHTVTNGGAFTVSIGPLPNPAAFVRTNILSNGTSTNWIVQAIFVGSSAGLLDSNITTQVRFINNTYPDLTPPNNGFRTAVVELRAQADNPVTSQQITYALYLVDQLPSVTNLTTITNQANGTERPTPYIVDIYPPCDFFTASTPTNAPFTSSLLNSTNYTSTVVSANYAGYEAFLAASATAGGGRVEITASNLDLTYTRIRAEQSLTVKTPNLVGSTGLIVDSPLINYNLGSTNGLLSVSGNNLANPQVLRFGGFLDAWSGFWTNGASLVVTNIGPDPNDTNIPPATVTNLATNQIEVDFHVLILDAGFLTAGRSVSLNEFAASGTNIVLNDTFNANGAFSLNGDSLTVNGTLSLGSSDWASTNVHLKSLTNNGTINVSDVMELGNSTRPYTSVVNNSTGAISAFTITMDSDLVRNSGSMTASGFLNVNARTAKFEGGRLTAGNNMSIAARDLKMSGYQQSSAAFYLAVTDSVNDAGVGAKNNLNCNNGFNLVTKPRIGDLFGTTLQTQVGQFKEANHIWSAEDRGPSPAGFSNNVVIGHLTIIATPSSLVTFEGTGASSALYVDFLDLRGAALTDLETVLAINTNLVIYFADANAPVDALDGKFADSLQPGGRLRWVSSFTGPNSSVLVQLLNGQTTTMNRALRFSAIIDTDQDGIPNAFDCYPLDQAAWNCASGSVGTGPAVTVFNDPASRMVSIAWNGLPNAVYQVEYASSLTAPNWQPVMNYTNIAVSSGTITILDRSIPPGESQRYYRIRPGS
jgi:hypothetical protein